MFDKRELYVLRSAVWFAVQGMERSRHLYVEDDGSFARTLAENKELLVKLDGMLTDGEN